MMMDTSTEHKTSLSLEERFKARIDKVWSKLLQYANSIQDNEIRRVTLDILNKPVITFTKVKPKITLWESPAAPKKHHAYPGGLLDHTLGVVEIALSLAKVYENVYGVKVDRDIIIAASLLHDLFKYYQYEVDPLTGGFRPRSDWYFSHDFAMVAELSIRLAPERLIRAVAEVHGTIPFTSIESQIVHQADSTDSEFISGIQDIIWKVCMDIELEIPEVKSLKIFYEALRVAPIFDYARVYYEKGRDGLREYIKRLLGLKK